MRIVYVITRADAIGGATIHVRDLAAELRRLGHETTVLVGGSGLMPHGFPSSGISPESSGADPQVCAGPPGPACRWKRKYFASNRGRPGGRPADEDVRPTSDAGVRPWGNYVALGSSPVTALLDAAGVPYETLRWLRRPLHPVRDLLALNEIARALRRLQPDIVSAHTAKAGWIARAACRRLGIPVVYTPHGWPAGDRMPRPARALFRLMETAAARWCDRIICVCEYERRLALEKGIAVGAKLEVVLNGVRDVAPELRAQPGLSPVRICSVARFEAPKAHRTLIEALARLRTSPWELHLVGDGPREPEIRGLVRSLCLEDRVRFHGYLADPAPLLARSQLFVLSSRSEALPRSILEALRAGLPVVASRVGGVPEAVDDGVSGLLVPPSDAAALAGALERLAGDAALRQSMGASARSAFERRFRLEFAVGRTAAVYATVKSGPHGRGDLPS